MIMPLRSQVGYASGNLGKSMMWTSLEYLLLFYLTDIVGIPPALAGLMILVSLTWDGAINPLIGYWLDRRASEGKDYRPFLRWAPPVAALLFVAIFWVPTGDGKRSVVYMFCVLVIFRTAYALLDVPHNGLLALLPVNPATRTNLAGFRYFFSSLAGLLIATLVSPLFMQGGGQVGTGDLQAFAVFAGVILCVTVWLSLRPAWEAQAERGATPEPISPIRFLSAILANRPAMLYISLAGVFAATTPLFGKMLPYVARYVHEDPDALSVALATMTVGQMASMIVCTMLARRYGRFVVGQTCLLAIPALMFCVLLFLPKQVEALWLASGAFGFLLGGAIMVIWATAGDVADQIATKSALRTDAGLLAFLTLVQKASIGVGTMLAGSVMQKREFSAGETQSASTLDAITGLGFIVPAIGAVVSLVLLCMLRRTASIGSARDRSSV